MNDVLLPKAYEWRNENQKYLKGILIYEFTINKYFRI